MDKEKILKEIMDELTPTEQIVLESMVQGDSLRETSENCAISVAYAQSCRRTIYEIVGRYTDLGVGGVEKNNRFKTFMLELGVQLPDNEPQKAAVPVPPENSPVFAYQELFSHMAEQHNCTLLESELQEIYRIVNDDLCKEVQQLSLEKQELEAELFPFKDVYFKNLKMKEIAELAKKSFRLADDNSVKDDEIRELHSQISRMGEELKTKDNALKNRREIHAETVEAFEKSRLELENLREGFILQKGNFFVFNPKKGQPHRVYKDYASAYLDGKDVSKKEQNPVYILKLLTLIVPRCSFETIDISSKGVPENYIDDVIPF